MKKNLWLVWCWMISLSIVAQPVTNPPPAPAIQGATTNTTAATSAASTTNAPAKTAKKKSSKKSAKKTETAKKAQPEFRVVPLVAGHATVVASNVNVRGQAKLNSEVITRLNKGQQVDVLEEIKIKNSGPDEPSAWAHIILPAKTPVWVNMQYVDPSSKAVKASKLKIRAGPGEEYSVLGTLKQGDTVTEIGAKGDWMKIEGPAEASAFVAARYLTQEEVPTLVASTTNNPPPSTAATNEPPLTTTTVADNTTVAPPPTNPPTVASTTTATPPSDQATNPAPTVATTETPEPKPDEPPPKRIVQREGIVRGTFSIQAPTQFELISPDNRRAINYLYSTSPSLDLSQYKGLRIIVTGEESLDERWKNTPVIAIQRITVVE